MLGGREESMRGSKRQLDDANATGLDDGNSTSIDDTSYYNCRPDALANPNSHGCSAIMQCRG